MRHPWSGQKIQTRRPVQSADADKPCRWQKGDRLWVRESFVPEDDSENPKYLYKDDAVSLPPNRNHWVPAIHMPRKACRLLLEIDNIRLEMLGDISESDALEEGFPDIESFHKTMLKLYPWLRWGSFGTRKVWVITFHNIVPLES